MPGNWWSHAAVRHSRGIAWLWRSMALVLCCVAVIVLLAAMEVTPAAAQTIDCAQSSAVLIRDCETLLGLKDTLDPDGVLNWAGNVAVSSWEGVSSNAASGLTRLSLASKFLTGTIPPALGDLTALVELNLHNNELSGSIPAALGDLSNLTDLELSNNRLSGSIPAALGDLSNLTELELSHNRLSGSIPTALGDLSNLTELELAGNRLSGSIPAVLGDLTALRDLYLHNNGLSGSIPTALGDLTALDRLDLSFNELSGSIPGELGSITDLRALRLDNNRLSGSIPAALGNLSSLRHMSLDNNRLSGSIPAELGNLAALMDLELDHNELSSIATGFADAGDLPNLQILWLEYNQLSGSIPAELGNLTRLDVLRLDNNQLSGSIPAELGNLTSLEYLGLQHNQLSSITAGFADAGDLPNLGDLTPPSQQTHRFHPGRIGQPRGACCARPSVQSVDRQYSFQLGQHWDAAMAIPQRQHDQLTDSHGPRAGRVDHQHLTVLLAVGAAGRAGAAGRPGTHRDVGRSGGRRRRRDHRLRCALPVVQPPRLERCFRRLEGRRRCAEIHDHRPGQRHGVWVQVQARNDAGGNPWVSTITDNSWSASVTGTPRSGGVVVVGRW